MMNYTEYIKKSIFSQPENTIIEASRFRRNLTHEVPACTYYKILTRLVNDGDLVHLTKGIYYRQKKSRFGVLPISDKEIVQHYTAEQQGLVIGYQLYHKKGLTTQIAKKTTILSTLLVEEQKNIRNVSVQRLTAKLSLDVIGAIETLEILQNYNQMEELNRRRLALYMKQFASQYSEQAVEYVLLHRRYKKSTIALLAKFMDHLRIKNNLRKFLSPLSKYKIPKMEEFYELA